MQLTLKNVKAQLSKPLLPIYLIAGDVTLLVQQVRDALKMTAKQQGFAQTELLTMGTSFKWNELSELLNAYSLFSDKTCIDFRNDNAKFDKTGVALLKDYLANPNPDCLLLISCNKLSAAQKRSQWFKLIDQHGAIIQIWPLNTNELHQWIRNKLQKTGLTANEHGIQLLVHLTEGNLLATQQAIEKLRLQYPEQTTALTESQIANAINDNAEFNVFDLVNHILTGNHSQAARIIERLKNNGTDATLVLWAICNEIRTLINLHYKIKQGSTLQQALASQWSSRKSLIQNALHRTTVTQLENLLLRGHDIDLMIKGAKLGNPWEALSELATLGASCLTNPNDILQ